METETLDLMSQAEAKIDRQKQQIESLVAQLSAAAIDRDRDQHPKDTDELERTRGDLRRCQIQLKGSQDDLRDHLARFSGLQDELATERTTGSQLRTQLASSDAQIDILRATVKTLDRSNPNIRAEMADLIANMPRGDSELKASLEAERRAHSESKAAIQKLSDDIRSLTSTLDDLHSQRQNPVQANCAACPVLQESLRSANSTIVIIRREVNGLKGDVDTWTKRSASFEKNAEYWKKEDGSSKATVTKLQKQISDLNSRVSSLTQRGSTLEQRIRSWSDAYDKSASFQLSLIRFPILIQVRPSVTAAAHDRKLKHSIYHTVADNPTL